ncbi:helix-turn-helix transcriptional regulator [Cedecea davisae]|uniref:helix-turn-helix transcriptional regulator n=1 Tax=Cedecea davisae TaxID=158484 RepID=UPI001D0A4A26|nr:hypothetical protein [Cedecea davisae]
MRSTLTSVFSKQQNNTKKIVVVARCVYTLLGIKALCDAHRDWQFSDASADLDELEDILARPQADLLIIESESLCPEISTRFNTFNQYPGKTILLTTRCSGGQRKVKSKAGSMTVIDKSHPLVVLTKLLQKVVNAPQGNYSLSTGEFHRHPRKMEREVVCALLDGQSPGEVALRMGISYSAVSRYKMIALRRAGVKSLNEVIIGNYQSLFSG